MPDGKKVNPALGVAKDLIEADEAVFGKPDKLELKLYQPGYIASLPYNSRRYLAVYGKDKWLEWEKQRQAKAKLGEPLTRQEKWIEEQIALSRQDWEEGSAREIRTGISPTSFTEALQSPQFTGKPSNVTPVTLQDSQGQQVEAYQQGNKVFVEGQEVGSVGENGEFIEKTPSFLEGFKQGEQVFEERLKGITTETVPKFAEALWREMPFNPYYYKSPEAKAEMRNLDTLTEWAKSKGIPNPKEWAIEQLKAQSKGEVTMGAAEEEGTRFPFLGEKGEAEQAPSTKLLRDWIGPSFILSALPAATTGWQAAKNLPKAAEVASKVGLAPFYAAEQATGAALKYGVLIPITKGIPAGGEKILQLLLDTGIDRWIATQGRISPQYRSTIANWIVGNRSWLIEKSTQNMLRRQAAAKAGTSAEAVAKQAVDDTIREMEPLLLKSGGVKATAPKYGEPGYKFPEVRVGDEYDPGYPHKLIADFPDTTLPVGKRVIAEVLEQAGEKPAVVTIRTGTGVKAPKPSTGMPEAGLQPGMFGGATETITTAQQETINKLALSKALISESGQITPQFRRLAQNITGQKSIDKMTQEEAGNFIEALGRYPEKKWSPKTKTFKPQPMPTTTAVVPENYFNLQFGEPTPVKYFTSQNFYATKLGLSPLTQPLEVAKQELDLVAPAWSRAVDIKINELNKLYKVTLAEKLVAARNAKPNRAVAQMAELLNKYEDLPAEMVDKLGMDKVKIFTWFRNLNRTILNGENQVRTLLGEPAIPYRQAYLRHIANQTAQEIMRGNYSLPQDLAYWAKQIVGKKIYNPMEIQRQMTDDLLEYFSKDLAYVTKSMLWTGLKEIYLSQPLKAFTTQLNVLGKGRMPFSSLTPEEMAKAEAASVLPASTRKWLIDYVNSQIKGQQTEFDAAVNRLVTESGIGTVLDKVLKEFGRSVGTRPITEMAQFTGRLVISATIGTKPRQIIRNLWQSTQNLALYGVTPTIKAFLPADKTLTRLLSRSMFLKSYSGFEELPVSMMGKVERAWLWSYGKSAVFNARTGMKAAYHGVNHLITDKNYAKYGWASPQRTYTEPKGFLYPDEEANLLREMEFGAAATQYQYLAMGMPELFRHKTLIPFTRLQSWWMNYFFKFNREAIGRYWNGHTGWNKDLKLPPMMRLNWLKYIILGGGVLTAMGYGKSFGKGVFPAIPGSGGGYWGAPMSQLMTSLYSYMGADNDYEREQAKKSMASSFQAFVPGLIDYSMFERVWSGEKPISSLFFYTEDWPPDMPTWGIPPLEEEVDIKHKIETANTLIPESVSKLGQDIPADNQVEGYTYEMADLAYDISGYLRSVPDGRVTKEAGFSDLTLMYKQAEYYWDNNYFSLPAGDARINFRESDNDTAAWTEAYLFVWGKVTTLRNKKSPAVVNQLVNDYGIPFEAIPAWKDISAKIYGEVPTSTNPR